MTRKNPEMLWAFDLASMIQVSLVGYAVAGLFLGLAYFDLYNHMVAVLLILERIVHVQMPKRIIAGRADAMSSSSGASCVAGQITIPASRRLSENA